MRSADRRAKIRELIAAGTLPNERPVIRRAGRTRRQDTCLICTDPDPTVTYFWTGGIVIRLHAACDAVWKQERHSAVN